MSRDGEIAENLLRGLHDNEIGPTVFVKSEQGKTDKSSVSVSDPLIHETKIFYWILSSIDKYINFYTGKLDLFHKLNLNAHFRREP